MDFALKRYTANIFWSLVQVSILVLMDFALKPAGIDNPTTTELGFNPCFDGFCSKTMAHSCEAKAPGTFQSLF